MRTERELCMVVEVSERLAAWKWESVTAGVVLGLAGQSLGTAASSQALSQASGNHREQGHPQLL